MPRLAGVVVAYHPDEGFLERIASYLNHLERLFIMDNSEKPSGIVFSSDKIVYCHDRENRGIGARLNQAGRMAIQEKFDWLLTMDQDSMFSPENMNTYIRCLESHPSPSDVAIFGVEFQPGADTPGQCETEETLQLITSGSLVNLKLFETIGGFDEGLFIDHVDFDYCFRSRLHGHKTIRFKNVFMSHHLGNTSTHISFKNLKKTSRSLHAPIRMYYMTRNFLLMREKYRKHFPQEIRHLRKDLFYRLKNNILYNPGRWSVIGNCLHGILDHFRRKTGKK